MTVEEAEEAIANAIFDLKLTRKVLLDILQNVWDSGHEAGLQTGRELAERKPGADRP